VSGRAYGAKLSSRPADTGRVVSGRAYGAKLGSRPADTRRVVSGRAYGQNWVQGSLTLVEWFQEGHTAKTAPMHHMVPLFTWGRPSVCTDIKRPYVT